jgi:cytochrome c-type biogenesis protein CcmE
VIFGRWTGAGQGITLSTMSNVDHELAQAVKESEAVAQAEPALVAPRVRSESKRSIGLLVGLLVAGGALLTLVFTTMKGSAIYDRDVDDVMAERARLEGRNVRVQGMLKKGTLVRRDDPCEFRFTIIGKTGELPVHYARCTVPDTFKDMPGMDVVATAEGTLEPSGHLEATTIFAKCPSKYEMKQRANKGEQAPHQAIGPTSAL